jgi:hypothetical protein
MPTITVTSILDTPLSLAGVVRIPARATVTIDPGVYHQLHRVQLLASIEASLKAKLLSKAEPAAEAATVAEATAPIAPAAPVAPTDLPPNGDPALPGSEFAAVAVVVADELVAPAVTEPVAPVVTEEPAAPVVPEAPIAPSIPAPSFKATKLKATGTPTITEL